jgi:hypothetical protein
VVVEKEEEEEEMAKVSQALLAAVIASGYFWHVGRKEKGDACLGGTKIAGWLPVCGCGRGNAL